jgi:hypothetical protein
MSTRRAPGVAAVLAAVLLAGCSSGAGDVSGPEGTPGGTPAGSPGGTVSTPAEPSPTWSTRPPSSPRTAKPPPGSPRGRPTLAPGTELTLTGVVVEGVEANCLLLQAPEGLYLLVAPAGVDRSPIRAGARLTVRGRLEPDLVTTCQQGTPLLVSEVRPA